MVMKQEASITMEMKQVPEYKGRRFGAQWPFVPKRTQRNPFCPQTGQKGNTKGTYHHHHPS